jgi:hypothetical protein
MPSSGHTCGRKDTRCVVPAELPNIRQGVLPTSAHSSPLLLPGYCFVLAVPRYSAAGAARHVYARAGRRGSDSSLPLSKRPRQLVACRLSKQATAPSALHPTLCPAPVPPATHRA